MKQRYDLLAIALLMFTVMFAVCLTVPPNLDSIKQWQTLIGGLVTGLGVLVASWNVTRQMRLAAIGREQDRIERELPGIRAGIFLLGRFSIAIGERQNTKKIMDEFTDVGIHQLKIADFLVKVIESLPLTPDFTKRQLAIELFRLRTYTERFIARDTALWDAKRAVQVAEKSGNNLAQRQSDVAAAQAKYDAAKERFDKQIVDFEIFLTGLRDRMKADARKADILRQELQRYLRLN